MAPMNDGDVEIADGPDGEPPPPAIWPAWLWIGFGTLAYGGSPQMWHPLPGAAYFLLGSCFALLVAGSLVARFNRIAAPILDDLLPADGWTKPFLIKLLSALLIGMEAVMVAHLARTVILGLAS